MVHAIANTTLKQTPACEVEVVSPAQRVERLRRRVTRLQKMGMFDVTESLYVSRVSNLMELKHAYHLVHDTFVHQGYILPNPSGMRLRSYEAVPETATFVARAAGQIVGVIGLVFDSPDMGLPSDDVFGDEINQLRRQGRKVAEVTNLAVSPDFRATRAFMELSRAIWAYAASHGVDDLFISISAGHSLFFETVLGFRHGATNVFMIPPPLMKWKANVWTWTSSPNI
ncbi:MAG: hypothetical protein HC898_04395 [Phycisphaerales bacterium]|nr:hypothetical protein [Phycisphaerales bacterium]